MSAPLDHSINSEIVENEKRVTYISFIQLCSLIYNIGVEGYLWTIDAEDAYYRIPINKKYYHLLAIKWRNKYLIFKCLPFGLATAPKIYNKFADGLKWSCDYHKTNLFYNKVSKSSNVEHYLDDYVGGANNKTTAQKQMDYLSNLFKYLNIPTSERKCKGPFKTIDVLGWTFSTITILTISLTLNKRNKYLNYIKNIIKDNYTSIKIYEKLIGYTRHCIYIIPNAKPFVRGFDLHKQQLIKTANTTPYINDNTKFKISRESKYDLNIWEGLLSNIDNYTLPLKYIIQPKSLPTIKVWTDATTTIGFGGFTSNGYYFKSQWKSLNLPKLFKRHQDKIINTLEMSALVLAADLFAKNWQHHFIMFYCDNMTAVKATTKGSVKFSSDYLYPMANLTKYLAILSLKYQFKYECFHIKGKNNDIADALSRNYDNPLNYFQINLPKIKFNNSSSRCSQKMENLINKTFKFKFSKN